MFSFVKCVTPTPEANYSSIFKSLQNTPNFTSHTCLVDIFYFYLGDYLVITKGVERTNKAEDKKQHVQMNHRLRNTHSDFD